MSINEDIRGAAEVILQDVDYDMFYEDLEERLILGSIESDLGVLLRDICDSYTLDEILDFIGR